MELIFSISKTVLYITLGRRNHTKTEHALLSLERVAHDIQHLSQLRAFQVSLGVASSK